MATTRTRTEAAADAVAALGGPIVSVVEAAIAAGDVETLAVIARAAATLIDAGVVSTTETQLTAAVALGRAVRGEALDGA